VGPCPHRAGENPDHTTPHSHHDDAKRHGHPKDDTHPWGCRDPTALSFPHAGFGALA